MMKQKDENLNKMDLKDQYNALSDEDKLCLRDAFLETSGMPYSTFYAKLNGGTFRPLEMKLFTELLNQFTVCSQM